MRILCGILSAIACVWLVFLILAARASELAFDFPWMTFFGGTALVLLWLAAGQPSSFTADTPGERPRWRRRFQGGMRIAGGLFGGLCGAQAALFSGTIAWNAVTAARAGSATGIYLSDVLAGLPVIVMWQLPEALAAWVLLRFAFTGRPLPPPARTFALEMQAPAPPAG
jgi:hypothetical protein